MKKRKKTAPPAPGTETPPPPRRNFLALAWGALGVAAVAELFWVVGAFLKPAKKAAAKGTFGAVVTAGPADSFKKGTVTAFPRGQFYLARLEDGGFLALSRRCTHLGCTVPWSEAEQKFLCPCHASAFDIRGDVVRSPAPRALDLFQVTIENGIVSVDTGELATRSRFDAKQVVYPA
jgi:cytochrome b6-f complex iron-sulfur subunit